MATRRKVARLLLPLLLLLIVGGLMGADRLMRPVIHIKGLDDGAWLSAHELDTLIVTVYADQTGLGQVSVTVDDKPIRSVGAGGNSHIIHLPPTLSDAHHVLRVTVPGLLGPLRRSRGFTVRRSAPTLEVDQAKVTSLRAPLVVTGTTDPAARISAPGATVTRKGDRFTLQLGTPPPSGKITIHAVDKAGNHTDTDVQITYVYPGTRAVWLANQSFTSTTAMTNALSLAKAKKIDSVVLDVKPENGQLSYNSKVPFAQQVNALPNKPVYDPAQTLTQLHNAGLRVIGRVYCYADQQIATDATHNHNHLDRLVTTPGGTVPYTDGAGQVSGNYVNLANPEITGYLTALGVEAAQLGFDEVLYDDCRKPDATLDKMNYAGLKSPAIDQTIADFLDAARAKIREQHAWVGATLDRQAASNASTVGQTIPSLTNAVDYLVPKLYPSQFKPGEFGVEDPKNKPYDAVRQATTSVVTYAGDDIPIVPALQDFTPGGGTNPYGTTTYGSTQLGQEFRALHDQHVRRFLLWGPSTGKYDTTAIPAQ
ncbi:MAG: putative glycoside hydrolase [Mycobacteriales bacterium]